MTAEKAMPNAELPPLNYTFEAMSLTCFLGERFNICNVYMQMLAGLTLTHSGTVEYLHDENTAKDFPSIAYLSHDSTLLSILNGLENVKLPALYHQLGTKKDIEEKATELLNELNYEANHKVLPDFMSVLQKRHLLIARSIILEPQLLFIENPFFGLEVFEIEIIEKYLFSLVKQKNITLIVSNPNLDFIQNYADKIILQSSSGFHFFDNWEPFYAHKQRNNLRF